MPSVSPLMLYRVVWSAAASPEDPRFAERRAGWHTARRLDISAEALRRKRSLDEMMTREAQRLRGLLAQYLVTPLRSDVAEVETVIAEYAGRILDLAGDGPVRTGEGVVRPPSAHGHGFAGWERSFGSRGTVRETVISGAPGSALLRCLGEPPIPVDESGTAIIGQELFVHAGGDPSMICKGAEMVCSFSAGGEVTEALQRMTGELSASLWKGLPARASTNRWMLRLLSPVEQPGLAAAVLRVTRTPPGGDPPLLTFVDNTIPAS